MSDGEAVADARKQVGRRAPGVAATVWVGGETPVERDVSDELPGTGILWFDIGQEAQPAEVMDLLAPHCEGLEPAMLESLLSPDEIPECRRWAGGGIRLASTFAAYPPDRAGVDWSRPISPSPRLVHQAVELLAGSDWLITRWHDASLFCGSEVEESGLEPVGKRELLGAVTRRWLEGGGGKAGDLGVLVMYELALTYAPAHRYLRASLEEWELGLYEIEVGRRESDRKQALTTLWKAHARLRDWLGPLNVAGLNSDVEKAWLPVTNHEWVKAVDKRVDNALAALSALGDTLRSSFHLLHIKMAEEQRERQERLQRRVELIAAGFLVPTLIVGFFGANTWVPGEHRHWGLTVMLIAMVVLTCLVMALLLLSHRRYGFERVGRDHDPPAAG